MGGRAGMDEAGGGGNTCEIVIGIDSLNEEVNRLGQGMMALGGAGGGGGGYVHPCADHGHW